MAVAKRIALLLWKTQKPLLFTQHTACGSCGAPEKLWDFFLVYLVFEDEFCCLTCKGWRICA